MKTLTTITLRSSQKRLRVGSIRSPAALPRMAVRGRAFLSEYPHDNRSPYYKGGQGGRVAARARRRPQGRRRGTTRKCAPLPTLHLSERSRRARAGLLRYLHDHLDGCIIRREVLNIFLRERL